MSQHHDELIQTEFGTKTRVGILRCDGEPTSTAGSTSTPNETNEFRHSWSRCDGETFNTRIGPDYVSGQKAASAKCLYETFRVQAFRSARKVRNMTRFVDISHEIAEIETTQSLLPDIISINFIFPRERAPLFGKDTHNGLSVTISVLARLDDDVRAAIAHFEQNKDEHNLNYAEHLSPSIRLLVDWFRNAPHEDDWKRRMKGIGRFENDPATFGLNSFLSFQLSKFNRPMLTNPDILQVYFHEMNGGTVCCVDFDAHSAIRVSREITRMGAMIAKKVVCSYGLVIEGRTNNELPEQMLLAFQLNRLDMSHGDRKSFPIEEFGDDVVDDPNVMPL